MKNHFFSGLSLLKEHPWSVLPQGTRLISVVFVTEGDLDDVSVPHVSVPEAMLRVKASVAAADHVDVCGPC